MIQITCECGARFSVDDRWAGRRAKCKRCGRVFTVESAGPLDREDALTLLSAERSGRSASGASAGLPAASPPFPIPEPVIETDAGEDDRVPATAGLGKFVTEAARSLLFFIEPGDLVTFLIVVVIYSLRHVAAFGGCVGLLAVIIITGWVCAFLLNVVVTAASGEQRIPDLGLTEGFAGGVVVPLLKFVAAGLLSFGPMIAYWAVVSYRGGTPDDAISALLLGLAVFLWPIVVLMVAVGGVGGFARPDLIVITIARTIIPYIVTVLLTTVATAVAGAAAGLIAVSGSLFPKSGVALVVVKDVVGLYMSVVAMRVVGLYYHHFKHRFAWSWG